MEALNHQERINTFPLSIGGSDVFHLGWILLSSGDIVISIRDKMVLMFLRGG